MDMGLLCFFTSCRPSDESPGAPVNVLQELTVTSTPEQVLLLLHSQLSSDMLVLLQGLQERGLCHLLARVLITLWGLYIGLLVHHSGLEKCLELECLMPAHFHVWPGLSLLSGPVLEPDVDLCVPLSSQLSLLPHVHLSQSTSSVLRCRLLLPQLQGLGLNLANRSHSAALFLDLHPGLVLPSTLPPGQLPLIHSHCSVSEIRPLSL